MTHPQANTPNPELHTRLAMIRQRKQESGTRLDAIDPEKEAVLRTGGVITAELAERGDQAAADYDAAIEADRDIDGRRHQHADRPPEKYRGRA